MDFSAFLNTVITMFVILIVGFVLGKIKVIDSAASKMLSKLIVTVAQPALIINSIISSPYSADNLKLAAISLIFAFAMHFIMAIIAFVACIKLKEADERKITEFAMLMGNCGFIGFPIFESLFGAEGLFLGAFFIISFQITLWTWGLMILARKRTDIKIKLKQIFINKGTVASLIGFVIFLIIFLSIGGGRKSFVKLNDAFTEILSLVVPQVIINELNRCLTALELINIGGNKIAVFFIRRALITFGYLGSLSLKLLNNSTLGMC